MTETDKDLVLGYDFGTSAVKAALIRRDGSIAARGSAPYPLQLPASGWAEQRPEDWWAAMRKVTASVMADAGAGPARLAAIGICAQMCGVVPVDAGGAALSPCLIWLDTRSAGLARKVWGGSISLAGYAPVNLYRWMRITGGAPNLSGKDPTSKMLWLREHAPQAWQRVHKLLDVKDYIVRRCTQQSVTSFDTAHLTWLFDAREGRKQWSSELLRRVGLDSDLLPDVMPATGVAGGLAADAAAELGLAAGTPVTAGFGDVSAAALSSGAVAPGAAHICVGTSAWFGAHLAKSRVDPLTGIGTICRADGEGYLLIAAQESAGASLRWVMEAMGFAPEGFDAFENLAREARPQAGAPMFFPWLYGERAPIQDERVRGGFLNLSMEHSRAGMARAAYEGVALNLRWAMVPFDRLAGTPGTPLRITGGGANSAFWCQMFADMLGRQIERVEAADLGGAKGGAMTAAVAAGWYKNIAAAAAAMTRVERTFLPDPSLARLYQERFALFAAAYRRLRPWYRRLSGNYAAPGRN